MHGIVPAEPKEMTTYTVSFVGIEIRDCVKAMERLIRIKIGHSRSIKSKEYYRTFAQKISRTFFSATGSGLIAIHIIPHHTNLKLSNFL